MQIKKRCRSNAFFDVLPIGINLSLGELACTASLLETVLLSLDHTRVATEEACLLEGGTEAFVCLAKSACETVTDRTCLSGITAAANEGDDVELAFGIGNSEGLVNDELESIEAEIVVDVTAVDGYNTGAGNDANASNRAFSSACAVEIGLSACIHLFVLLDYAS